MAYRRGASVILAGLIFAGALTVGGIPVLGQTVRKSVRTVPAADVSSAYSDDDFMMEQEDAEELELYKEQFSRKLGKNEYWVKWVNVEKTEAGKVRRVSVTVAKDLFDESETAEKEILFPATESYAQLAENLYRFSEDLVLDVTADQKGKMTDYSIVSVKTSRNLGKLGPGKLRKAFDPTFGMKEVKFKLTDEIKLSDFKPGVLYTAAFDGRDKIRIDNDTDKNYLVYARTDEIPKDILAASAAHGIEGVKKPKVGFYSLEGSKVSIWIEKLDPRKLDRKDYSLPIAFVDGHLSWEEIKYKGKVAIANGSDSDVIICYVDKDGVWREKNIRSGKVYAIDWSKITNMWQE